MSLNSNALTTLAVAKDYLDILSSDTSQDSRVERMINAASDMIERYTSRKIKQQSITEYHDGKHSNRLVLREWPALKPSEIKVDSGWVFDSTSVWSTDTYDIERDSVVILKYGTVFPKGSRNIKVTYQGGYATVPSAIEEACLIIVQWLDGLRTDRRVGVKSKSKGGENVSFEAEMPAVAKGILEPFIRIEFPESERSTTNV